MTQKSGKKIMKNIPEFLNQILQTKLIGYNVKYEFSTKV